jgi:hypothetical protein
VAGGKRLDRRGSGPLWFVMLAIVVFTLYSVAVAIATSDDCGDAGKDWQVFPPGWECKTRPGFG